MTTRGVSTFQKTIKGITTVLNSSGMVLLAILMLLGTADVIGRYFFNSPIIGTREIGELILGSMTMLGWAGTQLVKGHIKVDLFLVHFSRRAQAITRFTTTSVALVLFGLISWQAVLTARLYHEGGRLIYTINWPLAPFQILVSLGAVVLCLVFILDLIHYAAEMKGGD